MKILKNIYKAVFITLWVALLVLLGGYYLIFAPRTGSFSEAENRNLAGFPEVTVQSVFSGRFGEEFERYLLDQFPERNLMISTTNRIQSALSLASHDEYLQIAVDVDDPLDTEESLDNLDDLLAELDEHSDRPVPSHPTVSDTVVSDSAVSDTTVPVVTEPKEDPPIEEKPPADVEDYDRTLGMYMNTGTGDKAVFTYSRGNVAAVTAVLNKFAKLLPENGKVMFTMGPPSYMVNRYVNAKEKVAFFNTWDEVINGLGSNNVYAFDSTEILSEAIHKGEYVAFRTDNHWTPYGAYLMYRQMAARAGKELCSYTDDFDITVEESFRGTYYRDNPAAYMGVEPDTLERLMPKTPVEYRKVTGPDTYEVMDFLDFNALKNDRYTVYLGGPGGPWRYVECDNDETENCLVVTDSFGLTMIPFLTQNYKQVHYYDARYFNKSVVGGSVAEMMEKYDIQDVYVVVANFHTFESGFLIQKVNNQLGE